jgi:ABC-type multidrug transport system permease subunit
VHINTEVCLDGCFGITLSAVQGISISYFLIGFSTQASAFFLLWFTTFMVTMVGIALGMMFAYLLPNQAVISIFLGLSQNLSWLFNGVVIQYAYIPLGWRWFYYITPYNHASYAMAVSQMSTDNVIALVS